MTSRVRYDNPITANNFEEHIDFTWQVPYTIRIKTFKDQDIVPMHYAKTLEILVCENLTGSMTINGHVYRLNSSNGVFFIAPYIIHSTSFEVGPGRMYVIKLDFDKLNDFINIPNILKYEKLDFACFKEFSDEFDSALGIANNLIKYDDSFLFCVGEVARLIMLLSKDAEHSDSSTVIEEFKQDEKLRKIVSWTEKHYNENISIDDVASIACFSRYYFCTYFKQKTSMTYLDYLNHVRIHQACRLLKTGLLLSEVSVNVGFQSLSYFNRLFKMIMGITPGQYADKEYSKSIKPDKDL